MSDSQFLRIERDTTPQLTEEMITIAAQAFLATPGDQPEKERELEWARYMMTAALTAVYPSLAAQISSEALSDAAYEFGAGAWVDAFAEGNVRDDVSAVQATTTWFENRALALMVVQPEATLAVEQLIAQIEDLVHVKTGQHVFRSGRDGSFTPAAGDLAALLAAHL